MAGTSLLGLRRSIMAGTSLLGLRRSIMSHGASTVSKKDANIMDHYYNKHPPPRSLQEVSINTLFSTLRKAGIISPKVGSTMEVDQDGCTMEVDQLESLVTKMHGNGRHDERMDVEHGPDSCWEEVDAEHGPDSCWEEVDVGEVVGETGDTKPHQGSVLAATLLHPDSHMRREFLTLSLDGRQQEESMNSSEYNVSEQGRRSRKKEFINPVVKTSSQSSTRTRITLPYLGSGENDSNTANLHGQNIMGCSVEVGNQTGVSSHRDVATGDKTVRPSTSTQPPLLAKMGSMLRCEAKHGEGDTAQSAL
ncbi:hypothetical protein CEUSTIGMA_g9503.t1 [Chlamydomonas eustigma]|uniref:Uncharacterized protein n=1 Tax=Chlamydomonas eustigma TaxID=1157962 RepID=A0A250XG65_9CHLO|nr:hypothetical protein CEUSTIGMA_g9503.t1 [Chlamydomonas eustigma]|eukprot:GAX82075.1 hypothetical protein CEUSTIGMA_g9503.t1 [Chlamydomonas eustigma]